jgi:molybdopterin-guanine dinucleotide biosynthesis protein A
MSKDKQTFSNSFIHKTPQEVTKQIKLEEKKQQRENQLSYLESLKPLTFLSEDLKKTTDRFFNVNSENTLKQINPTLIFLFK